MAARQGNRLHPVLSGTTPFLRGSGKQDRTGNRWQSVAACKRTAGREIMGHAPAKDHLRRNAFQRRPDRHPGLLRRLSLQPLDDDVGQCNYAGPGRVLCVGWRLGAVPSLVKFLATNKLLSAADHFGSYGRNPLIVDRFGFRPKYLNIRR